MYARNACKRLCDFLKLPYLKFESLVEARVGSFLVHRRLQLMSVIRKQLNDDIRVARFTPFLFKWWQIQRFDEPYRENWSVLIKLYNKMRLAKIVRRRRRSTIRTTRSESIFILLCNGENRTTRQLEVLGTPGETIWKVGDARGWWSSSSSIFIYTRNRIMLHGLPRNRVWN